MTEPQAAREAPQPCGARCGDCAFCVAYYRAVAARETLRPDPLTPRERADIKAWMDGDDGVSLGSLFSDATAFPDVSAAIRAALRAATPDPAVRTATEQRLRDAVNVARAALDETA